MKITYPDGQINVQENVNIGSIDVIQRINSYEDLFGLLYQYW